MFGYDLYMKYIISLTIFVFTLSPICNAASLVGRLGVGYTQHLDNGSPSLSLKLQRNRSTAIGGVFGLDSSSEGTFYTLGGKVYRYIYEEPQLNFYSALGFHLFTYQNTETEETEQGHQVNGLFGTEFSFQGLESIGFSFEFGMGLSKFQGKTHIKTLGHGLLLSAVHFYI